MGGGELAWPEARQLVELGGDSRWHLELSRESRRCGAEEEESNCPQDRAGSRWSGRTWASLGDLFLACPSPTSSGRSPLLLQRTRISFLKRDALLFVDSPQPQAGASSAAGSCQVLCFSRSVAESSSHTGVVTAAVESTRLKGQLVRTGRARRVCHGDRGLTKVALSPTPVNDAARAPRAVSILPCCRRTH